MDSRPGILLLGCLLLGACSVNSGQTAQIADTIKPDLSFDTHYFALQSVPSEADIFTLDDAQQRAFIEYYDAPENSAVAGHIRLSNYVEKYIADFDYRGNTFVAKISLAKQAGNCLSLAILTTALADLVAIKVDYQIVNTAPIYRRYQNVTTLSSHIRTVLYSPQNGVKDGFFSFAKLYIDYFPQQGDVLGKVISKADFTSMFYQNLAGEALVQQNYSQAYSLLTQALTLSQTNPATLNSLAVLFKQANNPAQAEHIYQFAMENELQSVNTITNYIVLLEEEGRTGEAKLWRAKVEDVDDHNPYRWIDLGDKEYARANFEQAKKYYSLATKAAPYLHESYFGLAKSYYQLGDKQKAQNAMEKALALSYVPEEKSLYQGKLMVIAQQASW
ncbi:MAG: Flp pilus assembly protein TadD [Paraglaciecola sp.]|jgi:Flp pilus assembly protein TadD